MNKKWMVLFVAITFLPASASQAQEADSTTSVVVLNEKSPTTAALLSGLIFPGAGSFYAGNTGHGIRHLTIGVAAAVGFVVGGEDCNIIFNDSNSSCGLFWASLGVGVANTIWSVVTAKGDAKAYNRELHRRQGLELAPEVVAVNLGGKATVGLQLLRIGL